MSMKGSLSNHPTANVRFAFVFVFVMRVLLIKNQTNTTGIWFIPIYAFPFKLTRASSRRMRRLRSSFPTSAYLCRKAIVYPNTNSCSKDESDPLHGGEKSYFSPGSAIFKMGKQSTKSSLFPKVVARQWGRSKFSSLFRYFSGICSLQK